MAKASKAICRARDQQEPMYRIIKVTETLSERTLFIACHSIMCLMEDNGNVEIILMDGSTFKIEGPIEQVAAHVWLPGSELPPEVTPKL